MTIRDRKPSSNDTILADWDTGEYSRVHGGTKTQRDLAAKHFVSVAKVAKLIKGREPRVYKTVNKLVEAKQELAQENQETVNSVNKLVEERTKFINFFNTAAIKNVQDAMKDPCENQNDYRARADTIAKGREVVLGKTPDTAIQINNAPEQKTLRTITIVKAEEVAQ